MAQQYLSTKLLKVLTVLFLVLMVVFALIAGIMLTLYIQLVSTQPPYDPGFAEERNQWCTATGAYYIAYMKVSINFGGPSIIYDNISKILIYASGNSLDNISDIFVVCRQYNWLDSAWDRTFDSRLPVDGIFGLVHVPLGYNNYSIMLSLLQISSEKREAPNPLLNYTENYTQRVYNNNFNFNVSTSSPYYTDEYFTNNVYYAISYNISYRINNSGVIIQNTLSAIIESHTGIVLYSKFRTITEGVVGYMQIEYRTILSSVELPRKP